MNSSLSDAPPAYVNGTQNLMVLSLDYYVKPEFTEGIYESCEDVYYPAGDITAIEFMCGSLGSACNPERWFSFMGEETYPNGNGLAPFTIKYKYLENSTIINDRNVTPFTDTTSSCDQGVSFFNFIRSNRT